MNGQAGVEVIGVPTNSSGTTNGVALAPLVLRERGLVAALAGKVDLIDSGDLSLPPPRAGGLSWPQLDAITSTALTASGCAGWSLCIYNPELDPARSDADRIVSHVARVSPALAS
jgi:arginase family enzyme